MSKERKFENGELVVGWFSDTKVGFGVGRIIRYDAYDAHLEDFRVLVNINGRSLWCNESGLKRVKS